MLRGMAGGTSVDLLWDAKARLGEAPVWDAGRGCVWWIDCIARMLHRIDLATGAAASVPVAGPIHAIGLGNADVRNGGGLVAAMGFGFCALEPETGRHSRLSHPEEARPDFHFNDGKCGPDGRFWVGSMPRNYKDRGGRLFRLGPGAVAATMAEGFTVPNGPGWSPDGTLFYIADSPAGAIFRYGFDSDAGAPNGGMLGQRQVAVEPGNPSLAAAAARAALPLAPPSDRLRLSAPGQDRDALPASAVQVVVAIRRRREAEAAVAMHALLAAFNRRSIVPPNARRGSNFGRAAAGFGELDAKTDHRAARGGRPRDLPRR